MAIQRKYIKKVRDTVGWSLVRRQMYFIEEGGLMRTRPVVYKGYLEGNIPSEERKVYTTKEPSKFNML